MHGDFVCALVTILTLHKHIDLMRPSTIASEYSTGPGLSLGIMDLRQRIVTEKLPGTYSH
jgi:hypothetical protein